VQKSRQEKSRAVMRGLMATFYIVAGIGHLLRPDAFLPIVPDFVPLPLWWALFCSGTIDWPWRAK
jgi:uncharacterized membrane protein